MVTEIRIYMEGGGDKSETKAAVRTGFGKFLAKASEITRRPKVIACGSRNSALKGFRTALRVHPDAFNVLLVDSEGPVRGEPWEHLQNRDYWQRPDADDDQCHLMVQIMEAWLVADVDALKEFYGQHFQDSAIPRTKDVEEIDKTTLAGALTRATRNTQKGEYHKIKHGAKLLARIDPSIVRSKAPYCERLFARLAARIQA